MNKDSGAAEPLGESGLLCGQQQAGHQRGEADHPERAPNTNPITWMVSRNECPSIKENKRANNFPGLTIQWEKHLSCGANKSFLSFIENSLRSLQNFTFLDEEVKWYDTLARWKGWSCKVCAITFLRSRDTWKWREATFPRWHELSFRKKDLLVALEAVHCNTRSRRKSRIQQQVCKDVAPRAYIWVAQCNSMQSWTLWTQRRPEIAKQIQ